MPEVEHAPPLRWHWPAAVLAVTAAVVAIWARHHLFPALSWNRDEPVYLWHAELLRQGQLTGTHGGHPDLFRNWLSATRDGVQFTQYTLGWPLVLLAARVVTGTAAAALPLSAACAVGGTYSLAFELTRRRRTAAVAGALLVASPILPIQSGVYLSYMFTLGLGMGAGALLLSGVRRGRPARLAAAGVLLGWTFLTRPYDALLWGLAFGLALVLTDRSRRRAVRALAVVAATGAPFVALALLYNRHVTGHPFEFPITAADPLDGFGFGHRRLMPGFEIVDYDLPRALRSSAKNAFVLPWFLVGGYLGLAVAAAGAWQLRRDRALTVLALTAAVFPLGYFVFWGTYLSSLASRISGPIYLIPLYGVICVLAAHVVDGLWSARRPLAIGLLGVLAVATLPGAVTRFDVNREISRQQEPWRASVTSVARPSLVFVADTGRYLLFTNPFSANTPSLGGEILYASAGTPAMLDLLAEQPGRTPYLQEGSVAAEDLGPRENPRRLAVQITRIAVERGASLEAVVRVEPPPSASFVDVRVSTGAADTSRLRIVEPGSGPLEVVLPLVQDGVAGGLRVASRGVLQVTVGFGSSAEEARSTSGVRRSTPYRVAARSIEVVTPTVAERRYPVGAEHQWRHVTHLPELTVTVRPPAG